MPFMLLHAAAGEAHAMPQLSTSAAAAYERYVECLGRAAFDRQDEAASDTQRAIAVRATCKQAMISAQRLLSDDFVKLDGLTSGAAASKAEAIVAQVDQRVDSVFAQFRQSK